MARANERAGMHPPTFPVQMPAHSTHVDTNTGGLVLVLVLLWWAVWFLWSISS